MNPIIRMRTVAPAPLTSAGLGRAPHALRETSSGPSIAGTPHDGSGNR